MLRGSSFDLISIHQCSLIYSAHNIEHPYAHEVPVALDEFRRVLQDDGVVVIVCPDLQSVCGLVAEDKLHEPTYVSGMRPIAPIDILYGHRPATAAGNLFMAHRFGFTLKIPQAALSAAGFASFAGFRKSTGSKLWAVATVGIVEGPVLEKMALAHFPLN